MLELLKARAGEEGLNIETRVMDGHALELDDNIFDLAGSQFGVMLFEDMPLGLRENGVQDRKGSVGVADLE
jgi:ubiquinone/menaquinone biosynthesis C-methylase UbiE